MLYATHLVPMLHPELAWIHPSGVLKYRSSTYAIILSCQIYEAAGFNTPNNRKQRFGSVLLFFDGHVTHWSSVLERYPYVIILREGLPTVGGVIIVISIN